MPDLVTLIGRFKLFESSKPINSQMRFEIAAGDTLYMCSITADEKKFIASGKDVQCKVLCAVSSRDKFLDAIKLADSALVSHGGQKVGLLSDFSIYS